MVCNKCGAPLEENAQFCMNCGAPVQTPAETPVQEQPVYAAPVMETPAKQPGKGLAIASLVLGIVSFLCFPYITGILGIVFGGVAKSKGCRSGMATAGIACGIAGVALQLLMTLACGSALSDLGSLM